MRGFFQLHVCITAALILALSPTARADSPQPSWTGSSNTGLPVRQASGAFEKGYRLYRAGKLLAAEEMLQNAMKDPAVPADWNLWFLSLAQLAHGETEIAMDHLNALGAASSSRLRFPAQMLASQILVSRGEPFSAVSRLLDFAEDPRDGPKALYHAGAITLDAGDTSGANKIWNDLYAMYPHTSFAHKAVLKMIESVPSLSDLDEYSLFSMARACAWTGSSGAAGDYSTALQILDSMSRRRIDRRLRDDVLLLQGDVLFKMSRYRDALDVYREARSLALEHSSQKQADIGMMLSRLYLGEPLSSELLRSLQREDEAVPFETLATVAALRRARGDTRSSEQLLAFVETPSFEKFLTAYWMAASTETEPEAKSSTSLREAIEIAEQLEQPSDRALAFALLAENSSRATGSPAEEGSSWTLGQPAGGGSSGGLGRRADLWRNVLFETRNEYLLKKAASEIAWTLGSPAGGGSSWTGSSGLSANGRLRLENEAEALYAAALRSIDEGRIDRALGQLRSIKYGYPCTTAAVEADGVMKRLWRPHFEGDGGFAERLAAAHALMDAGAFREAADELADKTDPAAVGMRVEALSRAGRPDEAIGAAEEFMAALPWPATEDDLREQDHPAEVLRKALYPTVLFSVFKTVGDSYALDPAMLMALARVETKFDPVFASGFKLGIAGTDIEALEFAKQFPDGPDFEPADLLLPENSIKMTAWLLRYLSRTVGETLPYRLVGIRSTGLGNVSAHREPDHPARARTELEWIADIPFRSTREFIMDFMVAYERYKPIFSKRLPLGQVPHARSSTLRRNAGQAGRGRARGRAK